ncbi:hypothetical protein THOM_1866 [Trachipleistophora hominis]|uniref:Uncharacterized protein n=1 Tax=Trachipleistophora hominis TaxID=72359 RepID=L7JUW5_TRAHO|nr:hypothetical protein THOM_1866 [Trachipleistophora hominis]
MEAIIYINMAKKADIIELDFFLKKHIIFVAEPSSEIVEDIKIEKIVQFYHETEKYVRFGADYFRRTFVLERSMIFFSVVSEHFSKRGLLVSARYFRSL